MLGGFYGSSGSVFKGRHNERSSEEKLNMPIGNPYSMEYDVVIEQDETGAFIADVPVLLGCHSWGETKKEALENVREAIMLYLEVKGAPRSYVVAIEKVTVGA